MPDKVKIIWPRIEKRANTKGANHGDSVADLNRSRNELNVTLAKSNREGKTKYLGLNCNSGETHREPVVGLYIQG